MSDRKERKRRRRRRSGIVDIANGLLSLLVLGLIAAGAMFFYGASLFYAEGPSTEDTAFLVEPGSSLNLVTERLQNNGLIASEALVDPRYIMRFGAFAQRNELNIKAGEFLIPAGASMAEILKLLTEGKPIEHFVTVPEGETSWQVAQRLNDPAKRLTGEAVAPPPEGSVLPGRYDFFPGDDRREVLEAMQERMRAAVEEVWAGRDDDLPLESPEELVILASIVEKETGIASERPEVAGLFINRLRAGMRLQTDPTIIYGITKGERRLPGGITAAQKAEATPYNTYVIDGLPPTPIANPGIESLRAVANPEPTENLYMMAVTPGDPSDGHHFARTLDEHRANEARYRQQERAAAAQDDQ